MTPLEAALRRALAALRKEGVRWAVVGGLAVSACAEPRMTRDGDVAVAVADDPGAERILFRLKWHGLAVVSVVEQTARKRLATARLSPGGERLKGPPRSSLRRVRDRGGDRRLCRRDRDLLPGLTIPVARTGHLVALKALARNDRDRPQDLDDIRALLRGATRADPEDARAAARWIEERGCSRGKRLYAELEELLATTRR